MHCHPSSLPATQGQRSNWFVIKFCGHRNNMEAATNIDSCCLGMNNRKPCSRTHFGIDIRHESGGMEL
jgi:hypothetical protein